MRDAPEEPRSVIVAATAPVPWDDVVELGSVR